jgi:hypothetical protein
MEAQIHWFRVFMTSRILASMVCLFGYVTVPTILGVSYRSLVYWALVLAPFAFMVFVWIQLYRLHRRALQLAGWLLAVEVVGVLVEFVGGDYLRLGIVEPLTAAGVLLRTLLGALLIWVLPNVLLFYKWRGLFAEAKKPGL